MLCSPIPQKNEVVGKDSRPNEEGNRNQNGRLYKERAQEKDIAAASCSRGVQGAAKATRELRLIHTLLLALIVLCATATATHVGAGAGAGAEPEADETAAGWQEVELADEEDPLDPEEQELVPRAAV